MRPSISLRNRLIRTVVNPSKHSSEKSFQSLNFTPKSLILLSNSRNIQKATEDIFQISQDHPSLSLVLASVDSVYQDYISEIWLSKPITFQDATPLDDSYDKFQQHKTSLIFTFHKAHVKLPLTKTYPFTDSPYTLCFKQPDTSFSPILSQLSISVPLLPQNVKTRTSLQVIHQDWFKVTGFIDNMIKTINDNPASEILLSKLRDANLGKTQESVFLELRSKNTLINRYQVIAGGGEYGAKSEMLVLDCDKIPQVEELQGRFLCSLDEFEDQKVRGIIVEQVSDDARIAFEGEDLEIDNHIRIGDEAGFEFNNGNFKARNDQVEIQF